MKNLLLSGIAALALTSAASAASLPNPKIMGDFETNARTVGSHFNTLGLDVRGFGAKCDGVTDDTVALQNTINVATGVAPTGFANWLSYQASYTAWKVGIGPNPNGGSKVILGSGACVISAPLTVNLTANSAFAMVGDGTSHSQIVQTAMGDGIDIVQPVNAPLPSASTSTTDLGGSDLSHSSTAPGVSIYLKGFSVQTSFVGTNTGAAVRYTGTESNRAVQAPESVIEDVDFVVNGSYYAGHAGAYWAYGLYAKDVTNLYVNRSQFFDFTQKATMAFEYTSSATAATSAGGAAPPGAFMCNDCRSIGGKGFLDISGWGIQAVFLERPQWVSTQTGITWLAPLNGSSGSLVVHAASGASGVTDVHTQNIGTILMSDNFLYTANLGNVAWHGVWNEGAFWVQETNDQITAPPPGVQTGGSYADTLVAATTAQGNVQGLPSILSNITVAGADYGVSAEGQNVLVNGVVCLNNSASTQSCEVDTYTGTGGNAFHPTFVDMLQNFNTLIEDSGVQTSAVHAAPYQLFTGGIELGQPGVGEPLGQTGTAGLLDMHSAAPTTTYPTLNDYDVRLIASGGTAGTVGAGVLDVYDSFTRFNSVVLLPSIRFNNAPIPAKGAACSTGGLSTKGVGSDGNVHDFYCTGTSWVASAAYTAW